MDIYTAYTSKGAIKEFHESLPEGMNGKYDADILIPVLINSKQLTKFAEHYKQFASKNQNNMYLTYTLQNGSDAEDGPYKYVVTSLWALKRDAATFKKLGVPFAEMLTWYNSEEDIEIIKRFVKVKKFDKQDISKYIHYANVYLTEDSAYTLHYKGQQ